MKIINSNNLKNIYLLYKQLRPVTATKFALSDGLSKFLDPFKSISYAQTGEDRIIEWIIDTKKTGFYVDVGCSSSNNYVKYF